MADKIKGITIEIGGDTSPLNKALSAVNKESKDIQSELKKVEGLLKFDPTNTELIAQKQKLLAESVETAKKRLDALKQAQEEVNKKVAAGEIDKGSAEYRDFERQVIAAEQSLHKAQTAQNDFEKSQNKSKTATESLKDTISEQSQKLEEIKSRYTDVVLSQGENSKEAESLKKEYDSLNDELQKNKEKLEKAGDMANEAGKEAEDSGDKAEKGGKGWEKFGNLAQKAGKVAVATFAAVGTGAVALGKASLDASLAAADLADTIDEQSQVVGLSSEAYQEYSYILKQNGMDISAMTGVSKTLTAQMDKVTEGNKTAAANFEKLGLSVYDSNGKLKSQEQMLAESLSAFQKMEDGTEKARLATELFGKQGMSLMPILNAEAGSIDEMREKAHEYGMVLSDEAVSAGAELNDNISTLKDTFSGMKNQLAANFLPGINQIVVGFTDLIAGQEGAKESVLNGVNSLIEGIQNAAPRFTEIIQTLILTAVSLIGELLPVFLNAILDMAPELMNVAVSLIGTFISTILAPENLSKLIDAALSLIGTLINTILAPDNIIKLIDAALLIVVSLANGIASALPNLIPSVVQAILTVVETLTKPENLEMILDAVFAVVQGAADGILTAIPMIIDALPAIITNIITFLTKPENIKKILKAGIQLLGAIIQAIPEIVMSLIKALPQIGTAIKNGLGNLWSVAKDIGGDLIRGLWNGISDAGEWLREKISGFFGGVVENIKDFFGIHSPSTLFRDMIGKNLVKGIAVGVDVETPNLKDNLERNLSAATDGLKASIEAEEMKLKVGTAEVETSAVSQLGGIHFHIGTFNNNSQRDFNELIEEGLEIAESYIARRREVFA